MIRVVLTGIYYPMAILRYFEAALKRRGNVSLFTAGPYTGAWIPWNGGMNLPAKYAKAPDFPLPQNAIHAPLPIEMVEARLPWDPDLWIQVDAGWFLRGRPKSGKNVIVATDPHVLAYSQQRLLADTFYCMQAVYAEAGELAMSRRSRGYAPYPIDLHIETEEVLACGAELKNTFTLLRDGWAFTSQHIGDMENQATLDFFEEMVEKFTDWFRVEPSIVGHDLHPDYLATRYAKDYAEKHSGVRPVGVQHHHAHIASVMVENGISEPVIGLALDGTGH